jgi:tyrosine-protein kinase
MEEGRWYHGSLSRLEAEAVLEKDGFDEGLFLVRESSSATGDFVLSIVHDKEVIHYQIRRRGEDALFSLSEEQKVIHGLDELIFYYQNQMHSGLQHRLSRYLPKDECPTSVKLHGVQNLLHRATAAGSDKVVSELLQCGGRDLTAKNHDGQCAVHLAAFYGHVEVLAKLIDYGANVNVADSSGYSPLHVACQSNKAETVRLLLEARANPTTRNQITSWVPLHEAAWKGHMACAQVLLDVGDAPVMSRTDKDETPADLARANGANDMSDKLNDWPSFQSFSNREDWLHPDTLGRVAAVEMLRQRPDNGTFLLRGSQKKRKTFVLSMCYESAFYHFVIETRGIYVFLDAGPYMPSLEHLVDHYTRYPDGS